MPLAAQLVGDLREAARRRVRDHRARAARAPTTATGSRAGVRSRPVSSSRARRRRCRRCCVSARATASRSSRAAREPVSPVARSRSRTGSSSRSRASIGSSRSTSRASGSSSQPGVANLDVTRAVADDGYFYAPDPSSQQVCTIGGNVAENSGGAHCLKHGFTVNHVTGAKVVLPDGELLVLGGKSIDADDGPDLLGVIIGSEGTLGIAVEVTLRIVRQPELVVTQLAAFTSIDAAGDAVSRDRRRRDPALGDGDHGSIHDPGGRGGVCARLPGGRRRGAARRARRSHGAGRGGHRRRRGALSRRRGVRGAHGE